MLLIIAGHFHIIFVNTGYEALRTYLVHGFRKLLTIISPSTYFLRAYKYITYYLSLLAMK